MKTVMIFFDSLNRRHLHAYGCDYVDTPNFDRLKRHTIIFDKCYVGSMPCIPARRDLQTGRLNFLHRSWGPMEPFDNCMVDLLKENGVHTHLVSDHIHYWEEGGATYHTKYNTWEVVRGQEGDWWKAKVGSYPDTTCMPGRNDKVRAQDIINRQCMEEPEDYPIHQVFSKGLDFLENNFDKDEWFLQIETFDPHEPFNVHDRYKSEVCLNSCHQDFDWPDYKKVSEEPDMVEHAKNCYYALLKACDDYLGRVLDFMDEHEMWKDTMLMVCTDHGYLLGEHGWWAKCRQPWFEELCHVPFFMWHPKYQIENERRSELVQLIDIAPTVLTAHNTKVPAEMLGTCLDSCIYADKKEKNGILFGIHGCHVNVTDGRYVYMRKPAKENTPLFNYTLMPTDLTKDSFSLEKIKQAELVPAFSFTKGVPLLKIPAEQWSPLDFEEYGTALYDLEKDPCQLNPMKNEKVEDRMCRLMVSLMKENDSPIEQYIRLGLESYYEEEE